MTEHHIPLELGEETAEPEQLSVQLEKMFEEEERPRAVLYVRQASRGECDCVLKFDSFCISCSVGAGVDSLERAFSDRPIHVIIAR